MGNNCQGGIVSTQQQNTDDCPQCKSIAGITQSADLKSLVVTYTDGSSQTFVFPPGTQGPPGPQGPAGIDVLYNLLTPTPTNTTGWATIPGGAYSIPADTLAHDGSEVVIHIAYAWNDAVNQPTSSGIRMQFNGSDINIALGATPAFNQNAIYGIEFDVRIWRTSNTTANLEWKITYWKYWNDAGSHAFPQVSYNSPVFQKQEVQPLSSLDWTATAYPIAVQANSVNSGDIMLAEFEVKLGTH